MLDVKIDEPSRRITPLHEPVVILDGEHGFPRDAYPLVVEREVTYQFRYVVHRQMVGFFTPIVFDVKFKYVELEGETDHNTYSMMNRFAEPFIEGALFMNHTSTFIVDLLKGQEAGYNRKEMMDQIIKAVHNTDKLWYSDWMVPPITKQGQRVVIYDLDSACSMLEPQSVIRHFISTVTKSLNRDTIPYKTIYYAAITAGYVEKAI